MVGDASFSFSLRRDGGQQTECFAWSTGRTGSRQKAGDGRGLRCQRVESFVRRRRCRRMGWADSSCRGQQRPDARATTNYRYLYLPAGRPSNVPQRAEGGRGRPDGRTGTRPCSGLSACLMFLVSMSELAIRVSAVSCDAKLIPGASEFSWTCGSEMGHGCTRSQILCCIRYM
jgi:hypothetical protein